MIQKILNIFYFLLSLTLLTSCAGYHVKHKRNPWKEYGVRHVTIPLFVNKTVFPGLNTVVTRRLAEDLGSFSQLQVSTGENTNADSILIGIIRGEKEYNRALITTERQFLGDEYQTSLGDRRGIYTPRQQAYSVTVELILIKNPSTFERKLIASDVGKYIRNNPKVIFSRSLGVSQAITRKLWKRDSTDLGGVVNSTQNDGVIRRSYQSVAQEISRQFQELILYAF
jgi:hypothetical protein